MPNLDDTVPAMPRTKSKSGKYPTRKAAKSLDDFAFTVAMGQTAYDGIEQIQRAFPRLRKGDAVAAATRAWGLLTEAQQIEIVGSVAKS
jgi:hypothetical protein